MSGSAELQAVWLSISTLIDKAKFAFDLVEEVGIPASYTYTHSHYNYVYGAMLKGEIHVSNISALPGRPAGVTGVYGWDENTIYIDPGALTEHQLSTVVHEATHALNDWWRRPLTAGTDEFVGWFVKSIYLVGCGKSMDHRVFNACKSLIESKGILEFTKLPVLRLADYQHIRNMIAANYAGLPGWSANTVRQPA